MISDWFSFSGVHPLEKKLKRSIKRKLNVEFTKNSIRKISVHRNEQGSLLIKLHYLFESIDGSDYDALVEYIQHETETSKQALINYLSKVWPTDNTTVEEGLKQFNELLKKLIQSHFPKLPHLALKWSKVGKKGPQKSIRLASFWPKQKEIRIHPYLKDDRIPEYYLCYILFHELCHAYLMFSGKAKNGKHHGPDFYALENQFPNIKEAKVWEKEVLPQLLGEYMK